MISKTGYNFDIGPIPMTLRRSSRLAAKRAMVKTQYREDTSDSDDDLKPFSLSSWFNGLTMHNC